MRLKSTHSHARRAVFLATNSATKAAVPVEYIMRNGDDVVLDGVVTRRFIWNARADVGELKIDDVALTVEVKPLGSVQLWEGGPYFAECNVGATKLEECGYYFWWGDTVGYKRNSNNNGWISAVDLSVADGLRTSLNFNQRAISMHQVSWPLRTMRPLCIGAHRGACRRMWSFLHSLIIVTRNGRCQMV